MTIVVPVHPGDSENAALKRGVTYASITDSLLIALLSRPLGDFSQDEIDREVDTLTDYLDSCDIRFKIETRLEHGDVAAQLCEIAAEKEADTVLVSLALKPTSGKMTLGSQVQRLLLEAPCDVLVVRDCGLVESLTE